MTNYKTDNEFPYLLTRQQASQFLGVDPKTFDKYIRSNDHLDRVMIGSHQRYTKRFLITFIDSLSALR